MSGVQKVVCYLYIGLLHKHNFNYNTQKICKLETKNVQKIQAEPIFNFDRSIIDLGFVRFPVTNNKKVLRVRTAANKESSAHEFCYC